MQASMIPRPDSRATRIVTGTAARSLLNRSLADTMRLSAVQIGPNGRRVLLDGNGSVRPAHDCLSAARSTLGGTGPSSIGPRILADALHDAQRDLGDGGARLVIMVGCLLAAGTAAVASGVDPGQLADAMLGLQDQMAELLTAQRCFDSPAIGTARAAGADAALAEVLTALPEHLLREGAIHLRAGAGHETVINRQLGFTLDIEDSIAGFATAEQHLHHEMDAVSLLVANEMIADFAPIARVLEGFVAREKSLVIVARGFSDTARATLSANRRGLGLHLVGLVPADVGARAFGVLEDMAVATGASIIGEEFGSSLATIRPAMLGSAGGVTFGGGRAVFLKPSGKSVEIADRRRLLSAEAERQRCLSFDHGHLLRRVARLGGETAEIRVGGGDDWQTTSRLSRGRAALAALRMARDGVVPGGGEALARLATILEAASGSSIECAASRVVAQGCRAIRSSLAASNPSGAHAAELVFDPLSLTIELLRRAVSMAATMLRIEVMVCE